MAQKRYKRRQLRDKASQHRERPQKRHLSQALENSIINYLYNAESPASMTDIARAITGKRTLSNDLKNALTHLLHTKTISKVDKKRFQLGTNVALYTGTLEQHPRGFGFVTISARHGKAPQIEGDAHIAASRMGAAMHGDTVLIRVQRGASGGRAEGSVIAVLERGPDTVAGIIEIGKRGAIVRPDDNRYPFRIEVDLGQYPELDNGMAVVVKLTSVPKQGRTARGVIIEVLGSPENIDVQMRLVIEKFHLPHEFSTDCEAEAEQLPEKIEDDPEREDLRGIQHVTIDGETAKDFDDAICVLKTEKGYRLYVSIADVSHFVKPGSPIDKDAYQRGTSIYFPGRVIPMLPEKLSNNLCSLIPDKDRLALTAILDFDEQGHRIHKRFCRSIITSHKRFTYTTVRKIVVDNLPEVRDEHQPFLEMLDHASKLARALLRFRMDRGSIGFSLPEPEIELDAEGKISKITRAERNFAHQIIEEFMLAANEAVAETFTRNNRKSLYRIHELPDYEKVMEFSIFAKTLDLKLPPVETSPEWFGSVLELCKGTPKEYIVNNLLLRTMQQARYSSENVGHFALATADYTHFTSPIRRYPDLMVHRELCRMLAERKRKTVIVRPDTNLHEDGTFLSTRERTAVSSERDMNDRLKLIYMENHLGESFQAIISGVTEFAFFVELLDLFISGSVPLELLTDDYYLFDGKHHRIVGEISGKIFQIGDIITVTATDVDKNKNRVNFKPSLLQ